MKNTGGENFIPLARPLAPGVTRVGLNDPTFSDLAGVLTGVKPVTYTDCARENIPQLKELCAKLKLKCQPLEDLIAKPIHHLIEGKKVFLLGRDTRTIKAAAAAWNTAKNNAQWAGILGYPECCIDMHWKWLSASGRGDDLVKMAFHNTRETARLDFKLNNVFNYSSRLVSSNPRDRTNYLKFMDFNKANNYLSKHVIGWNPCSYNCPASSRKAAVIFAFMQHHAPGYAAELTEALAKPVLFWDKFEYAVLNGQVTEGEINFKGVAWPRSLLDIKTYRRISMCDTIISSPAKAEFYRGDAPFFPVPSSAAVLLNFVENTGRK